jgi:hypothetical protein
MLKSIDKFIMHSTLSLDTIKTSPKMLDLKSRMEQIGGKYKDIMYAVGQKIGSHHVHGTWSSLLSSYLEEQQDPRGSGESSCFSPKGNNCAMHENQYMFTSHIMLDTLLVYVDYILNKDGSSVFKASFNDIKKRLESMLQEPN